MVLAWVLTQIFPLLAELVKLNSFNTIQLRGRISLNVFDVCETLAFELVFYTEKQGVVGSMPQRIWWKNQEIHLRIGQN